MASAEIFPDRLTTASIGVLAATLAAVAHEVVGHGLGCLSVGGHVTLLTSIYFKCAGGNGLTDAAGPLGSLAFALIATSLLTITSATSWARLFLMICAMIGWGWLAGEMIYSAALNKDDWAFLGWSLHWPPIWRLGLAAAGVGLYICAGRLLAPFCTTGGSILAIGAAAASAGLAGLLWAKSSVPSALEGLAAVGAAPAVLLLLTKRRRADINAVNSLGRTSWAWVAVAALTYALFLIGPARGFGGAS